MGNYFSRVVENEVNTHIQNKINSELATKIDHEVRKQLDDYAIKKASQLIEDNVTKTNPVDKIITKTERSLGDNGSTILKTIGLLSIVAIGVCGISYAINKNRKTKQQN